MQDRLDALRAAPRRWVVTGGAGFIGSHLVARLLALHQEVVVLDNFATGRRRNLDLAAAEGRGRLTVVVGDICDPGVLRRAMTGARHVLHHAALGSVPGSVADPRRAERVNSGGFVDVLIAARDHGVESLVYASSSAVYGDDPAPRKVEGCLGRPLSPYASTKYANELQAAAFAACFGMRVTGLRYFNVYGPRQDPAGAYAAVIPRWSAALATGAPVVVHGDGGATRDFCHVEDVVQANLRAALVPEGPGAEVFNIGSGESVTLLALLGHLRAAAAGFGVARAATVEHGPARPGDIRHSAADITRARDRLGFEPAVGLGDGLAATFASYLSPGATASPPREAPLSPAILALPGRAAVGRAAS